MNKIILISFSMMLIPIAGFAWDSGYGKNYKAGYKEGYTYNNGGIREIAPIPPIPPIPNIGESNEDAYTRGILDGQRGRRKNW